MFQKTLIIGLGLIGGSFAKALKQAQISKKIFAYDLDEEVAELAKADGVIDGITPLYDNLTDFDFIVLAAPLSTYEEIFDEITNRTSKTAIVIDLGSIKNLQLKNLPQNFIPCHPIAGSEKIGFENSSADLFRDKKFIICPEKSEKNAVTKLESVIKKIGAKPEFLEAKKHDEIYALVSHLPQFLSFLTKDFSPKNIKDIFFQNAFRLDNSDPEIWSDIFALNEKNLEKFYLEFFENLEKNILNISEKFKKPHLSNLQTFDEKFFEENFAAIFFRAIVALSYLEILKIKSFENYAGNGFKDFTSITSILNFDQEKLQFLIIKNQKKLLEFFKKLEN
jgi:prephenate dehydrogenase